MNNISVLKSIGIALEIMCTGLPQVAFGYYDPSDCQDQKVVHGSNCTLICASGFEVKGPTVKTCAGKKAGIWSNRNKHPKCVGNCSSCLSIELCNDNRFMLSDVMPPTLMCPENFSVPMLEDDEIAIVKIFPPPNVTGKFICASPF